MSERAESDQSVARIFVDNLKLVAGEVGIVFLIVAGVIVPFAFGLWFGRGILGMSADATTFWKPAISAAVVVLLYAIEIAVVKTYLEVK